MLWILMLVVPFPFIANTAGWMTAELGRQPWIIYNIMRTSDGYSQHVSTGNVWFTLLGFMGLYLFLSFVYFFVMTHIIGAGPERILARAGYECRIPSLKEGSLLMQTLWFSIFWGMLASFVVFGGSGYRCRHSAFFCRTE